MARLPRPVILLLSTLALCAPLRAGLIGTDQEKKIGRQVAAELEKQYGLVRRDAMVEKVRTVGAKVAAFAKEDRPKVDYEFNVLADKDVNAVACPGGYIYAFRGLVKKMPEDDLLAAVLAHECAHVSQRHSMETLERALGFSLLLGLVTGGGQSDLGNVALGVLMRGYSRDQEAEADRIGHTYLFKAGYDVSAMTRMLQRLQEGTGGESIPNFLRTHPSTETRIEAATRREGEILLDLGSQRPAANPPHLAIVYHPAENEEPSQTQIGEALARQLSDMLNACAQFRAEYAGARSAGESARVGELAKIAADQGLDGAVGLAFAEPPLSTKGTGRDARTTVKLSLTMNVVGPNATQPELTYSTSAKPQERDADEQKRIDAAVQSETTEVARALAIALLRPAAVQGAGAKG